MWNTEKFDKADIFGHSCFHEAASPENHSRRYYGNQAGPSCYKWQVLCEHLELMLPLINMYVSV